MGNAPDGNTVVNICGAITTVQEDGTRITLSDLGSRFGIMIKDGPDGAYLDRLPPSGILDWVNLQSAFEEAGFFNWMVNGDFRVKSDG